MTRTPGSQQRAVMEEKAALTRQLLTRGLTITQIATQLNCSRQFVRRISIEEREKAEGSQRESDTI